jgi:hypothetical protein
MDKDIDITMVLVVILAEIAIVLIVKLFKKMGIKATNKLAETLTEEQIDRLKENRVEQIEALTWSQLGIICEVQESKRRTYLKVLWYNTVVINKQYFKFRYSDITMSKKEYENMGLQQGSYVRIYLDPNRSYAKILSKEN